MRSSLEQSAALAASTKRTGAVSALIPAASSACPAASLACGVACSAQCQKVASHGSTSSALSKPCPVRKLERCPAGPFVERACYMKEQPACTMQVVVQCDGLVTGERHSLVKSCHELSLPACQLCDLASAAIHRQAELEGQRIKCVSSMLHLDCCPMQRVALGWRSASSCCTGGGRTCCYAAYVFHQFGASWDITDGTNVEFVF